MGEIFLTLLNYPTKLGMGFQEAVNQACDLFSFYWGRIIYFIDFIENKTPLKEKCHS